MARKRPTPSPKSEVVTDKITACTPEQIAARGHRKPVNLALQGGGAHGAFTWGVLDKLLEDDRLALDALSATSAGAMNAVVMAWGFAQGGRQGARDKLAQFWREVSDAGFLWRPTSGMPWEKWWGASAMQAGSSAAYLWLDAVTRMWSPYQLNPLDYNPLREVLERTVDFAALKHSPHAARLFICATNVRSGKIRVFENHELSADVEIDGEPYWDGGFMGNPAIFPLIYKGASNDVVVVHVNPLTREKLPRSAPDILDRMNEIAFNSSLMREMRAIAFVSRLLDEESLDAKRYSRMHIHAIRDDEAMSAFGLESKLDTDWGTLVKLRDLGRATAARWLEASFDDIGKRTTIDMASMYL